MIPSFYGETKYLLVQDRCICCFIFVYDSDHQSNKLCPEIQILCCWSLFFFRNFLFLTLLKQDFKIVYIRKIRETIRQFPPTAYYLVVLRVLKKLDKHCLQPIQTSVNCVIVCTWLQTYV